MKGWRSRVTRKRTRKVFAVPYQASPAYPLTHPCRSEPDSSGNMGSIFHVPLLSYFSYKDYDKVQVRGWRLSSNLLNEPFVLACGPSTSASNKSKQSHVPAGLESTFTFDHNKLNSCFFKLEITTPHVTYALLGAFTFVVCSCYLNKSLEF